MDGVSIGKIFGSSYLTPSFAYLHFISDSLFLAMAKEKGTGEYFWGTEVWHSRLLDYDTKQSMIKRFFASSKSKRKIEKDGKNADN